jgi:hypothetical protein
MTNDLETNYLQIEPSEEAIARWENEGGRTKMMPAPAWGAESVLMWLPARPVSLVRSGD